MATTTGSTTSLETSGDRPVATGTDGSYMLCHQATTPQQCAAAYGEEHNTLFECSWHEAFAVTLEDSSCSFEPAQGYCWMMQRGGTGCDFDATSCGMAVTRQTDEGQTLIVRIPEPDSCGVVVDDQFELCSQDADPTGGEMTDLCECACAENSPL